jgi:hypothetical protein
MITNCTQLFWLLNGARELPWLDRGRNGTRGRRCREQFEQGPDRVANRNNGTRRRCSYVADGSTAGFVVVRVAGGGQRTPRFSRLRWPAGRERVEWAAGSGDAAAHTGEEETMASGGFTMEDDALRRARWRPRRRPDEDRWLCGASSPPTWTLWWATWDVWSEPGF